MSDRSEGRFVPVERIDTAFTISTLSGPGYTVQPNFYNTNIDKLIFPSSGEEVANAYVGNGTWTGYIVNDTTSDPNAVYPINKAVFRYYKNGSSGSTIVYQVYLFENPNTYDQYRISVGSNVIWSNVISGYYIFYYNGKKYGWQSVSLDDNVDPYGIEGVIRTNDTGKSGSFAVAAMLLGRTIPSGVPLPVPVQWDSTKYGKLYQDSCEIKVSQ